jgi:hypothetical protein
MLYINRHLQGHDSTKEYHKYLKLTKGRVIVLHKSHMHNVKNIIVIMIILFHGLGRLTSSGIDALPYFPGASVISSPSKFVLVKNM